MWKNVKYLLKSYYWEKVAYSKLRLRLRAKTCSYLTDDNNDNNHSYRILTNEGSGSRKTNKSFNLIGHQPGIDKI